MARGRHRDYVNRIFLQYFTLQYKLNTEGFFFLLSGHLQGEQVALQTVTNEDGLSTEQAEQHSLDVSQTDGGIFQILLSHTGESVTYIQNHLRPTQAEIFQIITPVQVSVPPLEEWKEGHYDKSSRKLHVSDNRARGAELPTHRVL